MGTFINDDFLLGNEKAKALYRQYAKPEPIIDYHCHLPVQDIADDRCFDNLTQVWLAGDHYKWRAMRTAGVNERYVTGDASDWEKFEKWAEVVPQTIGNPLFQWTHLELKRYFGIDRYLDADTAREIWDACNEKLRSEAFSTRNLIRMMKVKVICTTDDPADSLEYHRRIADDDSFEVKVLPAFRPDKAMAIEDPHGYADYLQELSEAAGMEIRSYKELLEALQNRHDFFHEQGCRLSDHGVERLYAEDFTESALETIFNKVRAGKKPEENEVRVFKSALLYEFGKMDHAVGWVQQYHIGPLRNTNTRMFKKVGPDTGFDSMGDLQQGKSLAAFLDRLDREEKLAKTILYNVNPKDNALFATMAGNFQDGSVPGKIQHGSAWWFLDQKDGIEAQLRMLGNMGLLSQFVGMLTDSRSFLSFPRHEYFRRVLCNLLGKDMQDHVLPDDLDLVGRVVNGICYKNAKRYFGF